MNRSLREKWQIAAAIGLLFLSLGHVWSSEEEKPPSAAPGAEELAPAPPAPEPVELPPVIVAPRPSRVLALDTVVAVVNGEAVTLAELQRHSNPLLAAAPVTLSQEERLRILRAQLENLIDSKLILMEARDLGARIEESHVREFIMGLPELRRSFDGDLGRFLVAKGMTYGQLKEEVEQLLLFRAIIREKVLPKVRVPPEEVRRYYQRNIDKFTEEAAIHCFAITFLKRDNPETAAAVLTKMREALGKINQGDYFPDVAREYSEDPIHAEKGGDWGWITPGTLEKRASEAAFALKEGEYSGIVEGDAAYWILWVKEKRDRFVIPLSAAWKEIELYINSRRRDGEIRKWGQRLRLKAAITYPVPLSEALIR